MKTSEFSLLEGIRSPSLVDFFFLLFRHLSSSSSQLEVDHISQNDTSQFDFFNIILKA